MDLGSWRNSRESMNGHTCSWEKHWSHNPACYSKATGIIYLMTNEILKSSLALKYSISSCQKSFLETILIYRKRILVLIDWHIKTAVKIKCLSLNWSPARRSVFKLLNRKHGATDPTLGGAAGRPLSLLLLAVLSAVTPAAGRRQYPLCGGPWFFVVVVSSRRVGIILCDFKVFFLWMPAVRFSFQI